MDSLAFQKEELKSAEDDQPPGSIMGKPVHPVFSNLTTQIHRIKERPFVISKQAGIFCQKFFPGVTESNWNDWRWQIKNSITNLKELEKIILLTPKERNPITDISNSLPLRITPYYASLLDPDNFEQAIRKAVVPREDELLISEGEAGDPLGEEHASPVPNIVHRYPDRVLLLFTDVCSTYCRYCTRSHMVAKNKKRFSNAVLLRAIEYIRQNPDIRDVLISGGDPLTCSDSQLDFMLSELRKIPHVEIIRIGTKVPVVLPQRITKSLVKVLKKYHPLFLSIHFTHPDEITPEVTEACSRLADAGIPLGSQTVLLKGINDNVETMKRLVHGLLKIRVRPYYLYQCDPILGSGHFRVPVEEGLKIIQGLQGFTSGYAVPHYVIDSPGGGGKIPLLPEYFMGRDGNYVVLKNFEGRIFKYPDFCKRIS